MPNIRTLEHEGHVVRSDQNVTPAKADLAVRVARLLRHQDDGAFTSDMLKVDGPNALMPDETNNMTKRNRLNQLFETPVEVDGVVYSIRVIPKKTSSMYEKTRKIVAEGSLATASPVPDEPKYTKSLAGMGGLAETPAAPSEVLRRLHALEQRVDAYEVMNGPPSAHTPAAVEYAPRPADAPRTSHGHNARDIQSRRRLLWLEMGFGRLVTALQGSGITGYVAPPAIPFDDLEDPQ